METEIANKNFPSARYFQVHFEYLEDLLLETKQRLDTLKQIIIEAQQAEMITSENSSDIQSRKYRKAKTDDSTIIQSIR